MIVDGIVYVGLSECMDKVVVWELQEVLLEMIVVLIFFKEDFLYLDCVFNMILEMEVLYCKNGLWQKEIDFFVECFEMIEVFEEE